MMPRMPGASRPSLFLMESGRDRHEREREQGATKRGRREHRGQEIWRHEKLELPTAVTKIMRFIQDCFFCACNQRKPAARASAVRGAGGAEPRNSIASETRVGNMAVKAGLLGVGEKAGGECARARPSIPTHNNGVTQ